MCTPIIFHYAGNMQAEPGEVLLSPQQAAAILGVSYKTVNNYADAGRIACVRSGERGDRKYPYGVVMRHKHLGTFDEAARVERKDGA